MKTNLPFEPLIPKVVAHIRALNEAGIQRVPEEAIEVLATNQAKTLAFLGTTANDLDVSCLEYQAMADYSMTAIKALPDGEKMNFLNAVGHPLSNDELLRYFFGR